MFIGPNRCFVPAVHRSATRIIPLVWSGTTRLEAWGHSHFAATRQEPNIETNTCHTNSHHSLLTVWIARRAFNFQIPFK